MEKKNTVLLTGIAVATLLVAVVGATFAYFSATVTNVNNTQTVLKAANLGITFTGTKEIPASCADRNDPTCVEVITPGWSETKTFTVANTSDYDMAYNIIMHDTTNTFTRTQDLTWTITAAAFTDDGHSSATVQQITGTGSIATATKAAVLNATGTLPGNGVNSTLAKIFIPANSTQSFTLTFAYANAMENGVPVDQNNDQGKTFQTTVDIEPLGIDPGTLNSGN